ncbi:MAG TPA: alpha/beta fold hydrolase [Beijerinckiaceae bacterium]|jgi:hypothetical protein
MSRFLVARGARLVFSCLALTFLTNCAQLYLTQDPDDMLVRVGSTNEMLKAAGYADNFLPYALIADQTYSDKAYETRRFDLGDRTYCYPRGATPCIDYTPYARKILSEWRLIYAAMNEKSFPCKEGRAPCTEPLPGLGVQIWVRKGKVCREAVVAFRGTDGQSADDWLSNLRWLLRLLPLYDQYEQVQDYTPDFVKTVEDEPCFVRGRTKIVAVGHSLGGGLAQQASYMDRKIRRVFAFDPSFVTGWNDAHVIPVREENTRGLLIERVYEHGEILAIPRYLLRHVLPATACNPQIRSIRFNALHGTGVAQHSLSGMTTALLNWSWQTPPAEKKTRLPEPPLHECPSGQGENEAVVAGAAKRAL